MKLLKRIQADVVRVLDVSWLCSITLNSEKFHASCIGLKRLI